MIHPRPIANDTMTLSGGIFVALLLATGSVLLAMGNPSNQFDDECEVIHIARDYFDRPPEHSIKVGPLLVYSVSFSCKRLGYTCRTNNVCFSP